MNANNKKQEQNYIFYLRVYAFICGSLFLSGCGYISEPLPPLLNIPGRAENLTAVQRGSNIIVHFTLPALTTEGVVLKQGVRLDLRIGLKSANGFNADEWAASAKAVHGGATANGVATYEVPAAGWAGKQVVLAVKVVGANGRDAGWSAPVTITVVPPPEPPHDLTAASAPQGVHLGWQGAGNSFAVFRRGPEDKDFQLLTRSDKPEWTDATAQFGKPYTYAVQSVAKAGEGEAQSELSNEATVTPADTFPPAVLSGLTAVPSTNSIELVWERSADPLVGGYRVYRALGNGPLEILPGTQELPVFSDRTIESGKTYRYTVTAIKKNGMEGPRAEPVEVTAP